MKLESKGFIFKTSHQINLHLKNGTVECSCRLHEIPSTSIPSHLENKLAPNLRVGELTDVRASRPGRGMGSKMFRHLLTSFVPTLNLDLLYVQVLRNDKRAVDFYLKWGFEVLPIQYSTFTIKLIKKL